MYTILSRLTLVLLTCVACTMPSVHADAATTFTAPLAGDTWAAGSRHNIMWNADAQASRNPHAKYTVDDGEHWIDLPALAVDAGKILWPIPNQVSKHCRVRITDGERTLESATFSIVPSQAVNNYQWQQVTTEGPFAPRDGAGALVHRNRMWLLGGWNPSDKVHFPRICNNEVWSTADGKNWELTKPNTFLDHTFDPASDWEGRHTAGYTTYNDKMWIIGGDANQGHYQFDVWNSADGKTWTNVNKDRPVPWGPRVLHYTLTFKNKIWVMGGQTMPGFAGGDEAFYRDIWTTTDGVQWQKVKPKEPYWKPRGMIGGNVVHNDRIWILGGGTYNTPTTPTRNFYNDVWSSPDGIDWTCHTEAAPWTSRQYHEVATFDDRMWVLEGYRTANRKDVWYSADGDNWYELPGTPWAPRHAASVFVFNNALWMAVGNNMTPDVWKLTRTEGVVATPTAAPVTMRANIAVGLKGIADFTGFIFDAKHPDTSPYRVPLHDGRTVNVAIFDKTFGLNFLGLDGKNTYAQFTINDDKTITFNQWKAGGEGLTITIVNDLTPPTIIVSKSK